MTEFPELPDFLIVSKEERAATRGEGPRLGHNTPDMGLAPAPAFDWDSYYGPGRICHDHGIPESDEERAVRLEWIKNEEERREKAHERAEEKRLEQDDRDVKMSLLQHQHKLKLKQKRKARK